MFLFKLLGYFNSYISPLWDQLKSYFLNNTRILKKQDHCCEMRFEPCDGDLRRHYDVKRPYVRNHVVVADGFPSLSKKDSLLCRLLAKNTLISDYIEFCNFKFVRGRPTRH